MFSISLLNVSSILPAELAVEEEWDGDDDDGGGGGGEDDQADYLSGGRKDKCTDRQ